LAKAAAAEGIARSKYATGVPVKVIADGWSAKEMAERKARGYTKRDDDSSNPILQYAAAMEKLRQAQELYGDKPNNSEVAE
jgi:hypothetical protein